MMTARLASILVVAVCSLAATTAANAQTHSNRISCEGDSLSRGFNADDQCDDLLECISNFGDDLAYAYSCGTMSNSLRTRMGATSSVLQGENGATWWNDGIQQTTAALSAGGSHTVVIGLGGNDLLQPLGGTLPTQAEFRSKVQAALGQLVNAPTSSRPANVILVSVPDVVQLYNVMRTKKHFAFETCQGIWDDFKGPISSSLDVCEPKWWNPVSWLCGFANLMQRWTNWVNGLKDAIVWAWNTFGTARFPGGFVLNSAAPASNRTLAAARRSEYNAVLAQEAAAHNGINGVKVVYSASLGSYAFDSGQVSKLDCFHANRAGQKTIADLVWNDINQSVYRLGYYTGTGGAGTDVAVAGDTVAPKIATGWTGSWADNWTTLRQEFSTVGGTASDPSGNFAEVEVWAQNYGYDGAYRCAAGAGCYIGKLREQSVAHSVGVAFKNPYGNPDPAGYYDYWRTWVRPIDAKGNAGTLYASPWF
jgi:lysophospholipase L1-like esterase